LLSNGGKYADELARANGNVRALRAQSSLTPAIQAKFRKYRLPFMAGFNWCPLRDKSAVWLSLLKMPDLSEWISVTVTKQ
jgi:hypothetical protein